MYIKCDCILSFSCIQIVFNDFFILLYGRRYNNRGEQNCVAIGMQGSAGICCSVVRAVSLILKIFSESVYGCIF